MAFEIKLCKLLEIASAFLVEVGELSQRQWQHMKPNESGALYGCGAVCMVQMLLLSNLWKIQHPPGPQIHNDFNGTATPYSASTTTRRVV